MPITVACPGCSKKLPATNSAAGSAVQATPSAPLNHAPNAEPLARKITALCANRKAQLAGAAVGVFLCGLIAGCPSPSPSPKRETAETQAKIGDVEVRVTGVRFGQPQVRGLKSGERAPDGKMVIVYLNIKNLSETKKISALSWARSEGAFLPRLQDDQSNGCTNHAFKYCGEVDGVKTADGPIQPGEARRDLVAFEWSIEKVKTLKITLPAMQIGQKGHVRFTIPVTMIERK